MLSVPVSYSPSVLERIGIYFAQRFLNGIKKGELTLVLPSGETKTYGDAETGRQATMRLNNYRVYWRVFKDGAIGIGESYVDGDWETDNLPEIISLFLENLEIETERQLQVLRPIRLLQHFFHRLRHNSKENAKRNIQAHYDLGNEFFSLLLDRSMMYSSAIFNSPHDSLERAQRNKLSLIMDKAMLCAEDHVLEIGSGWGTFAINAAKERGCKVTTITLSEEQKRHVEKRVLDEGLQDKVSVQLCDYRDVQGKFDKIVSIEMMEAIGKEYLGAFFESCERLLKPNGILVVQVITMIDYWYDEYSKRCDWIQKHIFPGSHLPSLTALSNALSKNSRFVVEKLENFAPHYARTLSLWRARLREIGARLATMGYDSRFQRIFDYYLASCEAEFGTRWLNLLQITLTRPNNDALIAVDLATMNHAPITLAMGTRN